MAIILVPTPIGNLGDITLRALEVLRTATKIAAEDTRQTGRLLKHYQIETPMLALHQHNEHRLVPELIATYADDTSTLAVVTDAGTPGISDPGFLLVRAAVAAGVRVEVLPGASAVLPALVGSGFPCDRYCFEGFLPPKKGRQTRLKALATETRTLVLYESPHKLARTLAQLQEHFEPNRPACVARELTKLFETYHRGSLLQLTDYFTQNPPKGECVIVIAPPDTPPTSP